MMKKKKVKKITSGVVSVEFTEDLILEICSRLPPVSLLGFKSVSKKWYSLISDPHFLRRHTLVLHHQFPIPHSILLHRYATAGNSKVLILPPPPPQNDDDDDDDDDYRKLSPLALQNLIDYRPEHDDDDHVHEKVKFCVVDSCNGLLLYTHTFNGRYQRIWYVCNPITHDYIKLPILFEEKEEREQGFRILYNSPPNIVFDPFVSLTYKVVIWLTCTTTTDYDTMISFEEVDKHYRLYVYSSETRSWRLSISTNPFPVPVIFRFMNWKGVLCNGVLYWCSLYDPIHVSLCYDIEKDRISTLKLPNLPVGYTDRALYYFGECGGRLCLIENFCKHMGEMYHFPSIFDVMELNEDQQQQQDDAELWTVKYRVNIGKMGYYAMLIRNNSLRKVYILDLYKTKMEETGEEEEEVLLLRISDICIIPFNLSSSTFGKELRSREKKPMSDHFVGFTEVLRYNTITLFPPSSS